jgi:hypothetical protein
VCLWSASFFSFHESDDFDLNLALLRVSFQSSGNKVLVRGESPSVGRTRRKRGENEEGKAKMEPDPNVCPPHLPVILFFSQLRNLVL